MAIGNEGSAGASMGRTPVTDVTWQPLPRRPRFMEEDTGLFDEGTPWQTSGITIIGDADEQEPQGPWREPPLGPGFGNSGRPTRHRTPRQIEYERLLSEYANRGIRHRYADEWINRQMSPELASRLTRAARSNNFDRLPRNLDNRALLEARTLEDLFDNLQAARQGVRTGRRDFRAGNIDQQQFLDMLENLVNRRTALSGRPHPGYAGARRRAERVATRVGRG